jgi:hypothetical protein
MAALACCVCLVHRNNWQKQNCLTGLVLDLHYQGRIVMAALPPQFFDHAFRMQSYGLMFGKTVPRWSVNTSPTEPQTVKKYRDTALTHRCTSDI